MVKIQKHIFVCVNERNTNNPKGCCSSKNSLEIMTKIKRIIKNSGIENIRVNKSGCLGNCEKGVACVIYPEGIWYTIPDEEKAIIEISNHILGGEKASDYLMLE
jgi:(2Fe-2S) ferredoxin